MLTTHTLVSSMTFHFVRQVASVTARMSSTAAPGSSQCWSAVATGKAKFVRLVRPRDLDATLGPQMDRD